jgi:hypothetical protein
VHINDNQQNHDDCNISTLIQEETYTREYESNFFYYLIVIYLNVDFSCIFFQIFFFSFIFFFVGEEYNNEIKKFVVF